MTLIQILPALIYITVLVIAAFKGKAGETWQWCLGCFVGSYILTALVNLTDGNTGQSAESTMEFTPLLLSVIMGVALINSLFKKKI